MAGLSIGIRQSAIGIRQFGFDNPLSLSTTLTCSFSTTITRVAVTGLFRK